MATPSEKLADALEALHELQKRDSVAIRSADLSRTHRERLVQNGFLEEVIKGWYVPARPDETRGESTAWYASFWQFCAAYLNHLKGDDWCLSPEQSLALHTENMTVPKPRCRQWLNYLYQRYCHYNLNIHQETCLLYTSDAADE